MILKALYLFLEMKFKIRKILGLENSIGLPEEIFRTHLFIV